MLSANFVAEEELNEEDQQLKNELDMMVERLTVSCDGIHALAISADGV